MAQIQPAELPVHAPQDQPPARRFAHAHWPFIATFLMFTVIGRVHLPAAVSSSTGMFNLLAVVPALIAGSALTLYVSRQPALEFIRGGRKLAAALPAVQAQSSFYRNARRSVPDVIRPLGMSADLRTFV